LGAARGWRGCPANAAAMSEQLAASWLNIQAARATGESARPYIVCGRALVRAAFLGDGSSRADSDGRETADDVRLGIYR